MEEFKYYKTERYTCLYDTVMQMKSIYLTSAGIEHCTPGGYFGPAMRPDYHLHVVIMGKGYLKIGNNPEIEIHGNEIFLVKGGEVTYYRADEKDPWYYCWVSFSGSEAQRYMDAAGFSEGVNVQLCYMDVQKVLACTRKLIECDKVSPAHEVRRLGYMMEFISMVIESKIKSDGSKKAQRQDFSPDLYVENAIAFMQRNYSAITIGNVARYIGINRSYLTNIFKKKTGISPQKYLLQYRMNIACNLLLTTDHSVQEIAYEIGYDNPLTFSKMFKSFYGVSPRNYRNNNCGGADLPDRLAEDEETDDKVQEDKTDNKKETGRKQIDDEGWEEEQ